MAEAFIVRRGGGASLNYTVVGGTTAPSNPKENTIWVNTSTEITFYTFQPLTPSNPQEGWVWIKTGTTSPVAFNALKKNRIQVYPLSAKQYVSGAWVYKNTELYRSGAWAGLALNLFDNGDQCADITGGWTNTKYGHSANYPRGSATVTIDDAINISCSSSSKSATIATANKISLDGYTTLHCTVDALSTSDADALFMFIDDGNNSYMTTVTANTATGSLGTITLDVSSYSGDYYVGFDVYRVRSASISRVWLS